MASVQVPVLAGNKIIPSIRPPNPKEKHEPKKWTFSFRFWRQIPYFGFDRTNSSWFASLLEKLSILSNEEIERFLCDSRKVEIWRYHDIDWGQKNIPIQPKDLEWIPSYYRDNQEEFGLVQFQISKALGRVIGFWDASYVFQIVLLDPHHNMQPDKAHNYRVDPCSPLSCDYSKLLIGLDAVLNDKCMKKGCECVEDIRGIPTSRDALLESNVLMFKLNNEDVELSELLLKEGKVSSFSQIFKDGLKVNYEN